MSEIPQQLGLNISLRDEARFSNFVADCPASNEVVSVLQEVGRASAAGCTFLWGANGVGLTHLLQALCHEAVQRGQQIQYLPLSDLVEYSAQDICDGLECMDVVCIDDIDLCAGNPSWESALFDLYNRLRDAERQFVCASHSSPTELSIKLPDLKSRLLSGVTFQVQQPNDDGLNDIFVQRAHARGIALDEGVANFIVSRAPRDAKQLLALLDRLDEVSLREKRKITIPFVRSVLDMDSGV